MAVMSNGEFSQQLLAALPPDPFEQLEVAQRITSHAVAAGVSKLEAETGRLRQKLGEKETTILSMQRRMVDLEHTLQDTSFRLSQALDGQLEMFKKNLLQSLQEDDDPVTEYWLMERISKKMEPCKGDNEVNGHINKSRVISPALSTLTYANLDIHNMDVNVVITSRVVIVH